MFGERLRYLRKKAGIGQTELAHQTGINAVTISRLETGRRQPTRAQLISLAKHFDVSLDALTGGQDDVQPLPEVRLAKERIAPRVLVPVYEEQCQHTLRDDGSVETLTYLAEAPRGYEEVLVDKLVSWDLDNYFFVQVAQPSTFGGLFPPPLVLCHAKVDVGNGDIVLCRLRHGETVFRKYYRSDRSRVILLPLQPAPDELILPADEVTVLGLVVQIIGTLNDRQY
ncbi:MAG: helix-turn-helix domain-containing protein [Armatimonadota bacterium]